MLKLITGLFGSPAQASPFVATRTHSTSGHPAPMGCVLTPSLTRTLAESCDSRLIDQCLELVDRYETTKEYVKDVVKSHTTPPKGPLQDCTRYPNFSMQYLAKEYLRREETKGTFSKDCELFLDRVGRPT